MTFARWIAGWLLLFSGLSLIAGDDDDASMVPSLSDVDASLFRLLKDLDDLRDGEVYLAGIHDLLHAGASVEAKDDRGLTPLHWAVLRCEHWNAEAETEVRLDVVRMLLAAGADVNAGDGADTPLHWAAHGEYIPLLKLLLERGADPALSDAFGDTPLHVWARAGNVDGVVVLLRCGASVAARNKEGDTPLMVFMEHGHLEVARRLVLAGARVDVVNRRGDTPLAMAAFWDQWELVYYLITCGARSFYHTRLGSGHISGDEEEEGHLFIYLLQRMYTVRGSDSGDEAKRKAMLDVARLLIRRGYVPGRDRMSRMVYLGGGAEGGGLLHSAVYYELEDVVRLLVDANVDLSVLAQVPYGYRTPLDCALDKGSWDIALVLLEAGARTYGMIEGTWYTSSYFYDYLGAAAETGQWRVFQLLVEHAEFDLPELESLLQRLMDRCDYSERAEQIVGAMLRRQMESCPRVMRLMRQAMREGEYTCTETTEGEDAPDESSHDRCVEVVDVAVDTGEDVALGERANELRFGNGRMGRGSIEAQNGCG